MEDQQGGDINQTSDINQWTARDLIEGRLPETRRVQVAHVPPEFPIDPEVIIEPEVPQKASRLKLIVLVMLAIIALLAAAAAGFIANEWLS